MAWKVCCSARDRVSISRDDSAYSAQGSFACTCGPRLRDEETQRETRESRTYDVDELSAWISDEERTKIMELRQSLSDMEREQLAQEPEDIKHDIMLCRFLRGHGGKIVAASVALQAHLKYRRQFATVICRARLRFPEHEQQYHAERTLSGMELNTKFVQLQLPPWTGTNDGMPVSLLVLRLFDLKALGTLPEQQLREWFISCLERRSFTLHNQSIREQRMARVFEARDCMGFSFSQVLASPRMLLKFRRVFQDGEMYPELLGRLFLFNLSPGSRTISMIKSVMSEHLQKKVLFAERGDWKSAVCLPKTLAPAVLPLWSQHVQSHEQRDGWQRLSSACPMTVSAVSLRAGQTCTWNLEFEGSNGSQATAAVLRIDAVYFESHKPQEQPNFVNCCPPEELQASGSRVSCQQFFTTPAAGVVLVQVELISAQSAGVALNLAVTEHGLAVNSATEPSRLLSQRAFPREDERTRPQSVVKLRQFAALIVCLLAWVLVHWSC